MKSEIRSQIVQLILELNQFSNRKFECRRSTTMKTNRIERIDDLTYSDIHKHVVQWSTDNNIPFDDITLTFETYTDYDGWTDTSIVLSSYIKETDEEYLVRLFDTRSKLLKEKSIPSSDWSNLYDAINQKMYTARRITMDVNVVHECLSDLDSIHQAKYNCHNGQASDFDMLKKQKEVYARLSAKYH